MGTLYRKAFQYFLAVVASLLLASSCSMQSCLGETPAGEAALEKGRAVLEKDVVVPSVHAGEEGP